MVEQRIMQNLPPTLDARETRAVGHEKLHSQGHGRSPKARDAATRVALPETRTRRGLRHLLREGLVPIALGGLLSGFGRGGFLELTVFFSIAEVMRHLHVEHGSSPPTRNARRILAPPLVPGAAAFVTGAVLRIEDVSMYGWFLARYVDYLSFAIALGILLPLLHALRGDPDHYPE